MRKLNLFVAITMLIGGTASARPSSWTLFKENFENGIGNWTAVDGNPITLAFDESTCSSTYQHETVSYAGGRVVSNGSVAVKPGATYCLSAWVRGSSGGSPLVGVRMFNGDGTLIEQHWLISAAEYDDGFATMYGNVTTDENWHWYTSSMKVPGWIVSVDIMDEEYGDGYGDFDDIVLNSGACPSEYNGPDRHAACDSGEICMPDGTCEGSTSASTIDASASGGTPGDGTSGLLRSTSRSIAAQVIDQPQIESLTAAAPATGAAPMAGGCSVGGNGTDEGVAMFLLCVAGLATLLRRKLRRDR